jgi:hypothetical protein
VHGDLAVLVARLSEAASAAAPPASATRRAGRAPATAAFAVASQTVFVWHSKGGCGMSWGAQSRSEERTCSLTQSKPSTYEYDDSSNECWN